MHLHTTIFDIKIIFLLLLLIILLQMSYMENYDTINITMYA